MPSSTFSFDSAARRLPRLRWLLVLGFGAALALLFAATLEYTLRARGFRPTVSDSQALWAKQRARAAALGEHALILVGDSQVQTDFDLAVLHRATGLDPVELGIDGNSFVPVLTGLARDTAIRGTVLVGFADAELARPNPDATAAHYEADYERAGTTTTFNYRRVEAALEDHWHAALASYADGARPWSTLLLRALDTDARPQYVTIGLDRTRVIDYSQANLRSLRLRSAAFQLDGAAVASGNLVQREQDLAARIAALQPADEQAYAERAAAIETAVLAIRARGGRVVFVRLPIAGDAADIERRRYPRATFWDRFAASSSARCLRSEDDARLRAFVPPDDLHLDGSARPAFSAAVVAALDLAPR